MDHTAPRLVGVVPSQRHRRHGTSDDRSGAERRSPRARRTIMRPRPRVATISTVAAATLAVVGLSIHAPTASSEGIQAQAQVISNIAYTPAQPAGSEGQLLDLYLPDGGSGLRPLVIWSSGSA
jgi:hypothetical protein